MRLLVQSVSSLTVRTGRVHAQRCIATSSAVRKDLVQDMYLRELKAYKPSPKAKDAHVGAVREFKAPTAPEAPSLPSDFAAELSAYDASEPTLAPKSGSPAATSSSEGGHEKADGKLTGPALLKFLEQDLPKEDHHHH